MSERGSDGYDLRQAISPAMSPATSDETMPARRAKHIRLNTPRKRDTPMRPERSGATAGEPVVGLLPEHPLSDDIFENQGPDVARSQPGPDRRSHKLLDGTGLRDRWRRPPNSSELEHRSTVGLVLARPLLLLLCALLGGIVGLALGGRQGFQSSVVLQFTTQGSDSTLVKQNGQTIAQTIATSNVINTAAATLGSAGAGLADRVSAQWQTDTQLVTITVTADSSTAAVTQVNAVAQAVVKLNAASIQERLKDAHDESNQVLLSDKLTSAAAESARVAQLGSSLGTLQDSIASQANALTITDLATTGKIGGFTKTMSAAVGVVAGILLGGLLSLLLGLRGLGAPSERVLRRLAPGLDLRSGSQAAQIAGELAESDHRCLAVIALPGAREQAIRLAEDVAFFVRSAGLSVALKGPNELDDRAVAGELLRRDQRTNIRGRFGADILIVVVSARSDASALLQGQSELSALVVMRRRRTPIALALQAMNAFRRAEPVLVLAG